MLLKDCTLEQLQEQRNSLINESNPKWKNTFMYKDRLAEIDRCINLKNNIMLNPGHTERLMIQLSNSSRLTEEAFHKIWNALDDEHKIIFTDWLQHANRIRLHKNISI